MSKYVQIPDEEYNDLVAVIEPFGRFIRKYGYNPMYNQKYRDIITAFIMGKTLDPSFRIKRANKGLDYINENGEGELKTKAVKELKKGGYSSTGNFEFEKQDEEIRRKEALECPSFTFALFDKFRPAKLILSVYFDAKDCASQFRETLRKRVDEYLLREEKWKQEGQARRRDTASVSVMDVLSVDHPNVRYTTEDKEINRSDALKILNFDKTYPVVEEE